MIKLSTFEKLGLKLTCDGPFSVYILKCNGWNSPNCVCAFVWWSYWGKLCLWVKTPWWGSHHRRSELALARVSPPGSFFFFKVLILSSRSCNDTVRLWSLSSGSIYKTACCSGTDSLSESGREPDLHTQLYTSEVAENSGKAFNLFLAALLGRRRDSGSGVLPAV